MYKNRKKYRTIIYLLSLFYVNLFFLSPHVHHHHSDNEDLHSHPHSVSGEKSEIIHTHLFYDSDNLHSKESDNHYHNEENHSSYLFQANYVSSLKAFRDLLPSLNIDFYSIVEYSIKEREISVIDTPTISGFSKLQWNKYVQSATNLSPPLGYNI
ncbi:MAG: hypothetical protein L3J41_09715 [Melioribacteraceae bacterium]|nr:hypothetical protein [Melioribacteraceae bacterium]